LTREQTACYRNSNNFVEGSLKQLSPALIHAIVWVPWAILVIVGWTLSPLSNGAFGAVSGWFSVGLFSLGLLSAGLFSAGVYSAGLFSIGIFSAGVFSVGIFSFGTYSIGIWASGQYPVGIFTSQLK
jgi:hypothetical protein